MIEYGVGGQERKIELSPGISDIPQNRTLLVEKLTADAPMRPDIVKNLKTMDEVFEAFQPEAEVAFTDATGGTLNETFRFRKIADFSKNGLVNQSEFMQNLNLQYEDFQKFARQLRTNKILKTVLEDPEAKAAYLSALATAIKELEESK
jgi:hypothetical protein